MILDNARGLSFAECWKITIIAYLLKLYFDTAFFSTFKHQTVFYLIFIFYNQLTLTMLNIIIVYIYNEEYCKKN